LINFVDRSQRANHYARPPANRKERITGVFCTVTVYIMYLNLQQMARLTTRVPTESSHLDRKQLE